MEENTVSLLDIGCFAVSRRAVIEWVSEMTRAHGREPIAEVLQIYGDDTMEPTCLCQHEQPVVGCRMFHRMQVWRPLLGDL